MKFCKECGCENTNRKTLCNKCYYKNNKQHFMERYTKNKESIRIVQKEYREKNRDLLNKKARDKIAKNKEEFLEKNRKKYQDTKEKQAEYKKRYCEKHKDKIIERRVAYRQTEKGKAQKKNSDHKRRLQKINAESRTVSLKEMIELISNRKKCFYCKCDVTEKYHIDHYIPLSKGGLHTIDNLVVSCPKCNLVKSDMMPEDFMKKVSL